MPRLLPAILAGLAIALPAAAEPIDDAVDRMAGKVMSDQNLSLFFDLLRQSLAAAAEGKAAPEISAEEKARLEALNKELKREAIEASMKMLDEVEKEMRNSLRAEPAGK